MKHPAHVDRVLNVSAAALFRYFVHVLFGKPMIIPRPVLSLIHQHERHHRNGNRERRRPKSAQTRFLGSQVSIEGPLVEGCFSVERSTPV